MSKYTDIKKILFLPIKQTKQQHLPHIGKSSVKDNKNKVKKCKTATTQRLTLTPVTAEST